MAGRTTDRTEPERLGKNIDLTNLEDPWQRFRGPNAAAAATESPGPGRVSPALAAGGIMMPGRRAGLTQRQARAEAGSHGHGASAATVTDSADHQGSAAAAAATCRGRGGRRRAALAGPRPGTYAQSVALKP